MLYPYRKYRFCARSTTKQDADCYAGLGSKCPKSKIHSRLLPWTQQLRRPSSSCLWPHSSSCLRFCGGVCSHRVTKRRRRIINRMCLRSLGSRRQCPGRNPTPHRLHLIWRTREQQQQTFSGWKTNKSTVLFANQFLFVLLDGGLGKHPV